MAFDLLKRSFCFLKPQFAFSFWCFPQAKGALTYSNPSLLSHFGVFRKQKELWLTQTPVYFLILVFSASKRNFDLLKPQFTFSFRCFPQVIKHIAFSTCLIADSLNAIEIISFAIEEMNSPTDEQAALIGITLEDRKMIYPDRYDQENLLNLHKAKMSLEQAVDLLSQ